MPVTRSQARRAIASRQRIFGSFVFQNVPQDLRDDLVQEVTAHMTAGTLHGVFGKPEPPEDSIDPVWCDATYGGPTGSTLTVSVGLTSDTDFQYGELTQAWSTLAGGRMLALWRPRRSKITHVTDPDKDWYRIQADLFFA